MDKTLRLLIICCLCSFSALAQVTISPLEVRAKGSVSEPFEAFAMLWNTSSHVLHLQVTKENANVPENWYISLVQNKESHSPYANTFRLSLQPGESSRIGIMFFPEENQGQSSVELVVKEVGDDGNVLARQTFTGKAGNQKGSFNSVVWTLFPNPATAHFKISNYNDVQKVEVYNIIGKSLKEFRVNTFGQQFEIGDLPRGIYLVRILDFNGKVLSTQRLNVVKP